MARKDIEAQAAQSAELTPYERFARMVQGRAVAEEAAGSTAADLAGIQVEKLLGAQTPSELFDAMEFEGLRGLRDIDGGSILRITGFKLVKSANEELSKGLGAYAVIEAHLDGDSEVTAYDTSIPRVIAWLIQAETLGLFPCDVQLHKKQTGSGNTMITFKPVKSRPVRGETVSDEAPF